ncbi:MAG: SMP-30/gluconolactonase/LRE family protein [Bacteroidota bacterium]
MNKSLHRYIGIIGLLLLLVTLANCSEDKSVPNWDHQLDSTNVNFRIEGLAGPESVRFDPDQQIYFISNFNGGGTEADSNGFITRASAKGEIESLQYMTGTEAFPLHAPRGMYITGDTLWVCDISGVHGFHRSTGEQLRFVDFSHLEPGFLNDIASGTGDQLYVTDTGKNRVYRMQGNQAEVALDSLPFGPNGITHKPHTRRLVIAPWGGSRTFIDWDPTSGHQNQIALNSGGYFDGIEPAEGRMLISSQQDSAIYSMTNNTASALIQVPGRPADIGLNLTKWHVAVPYISLDRVDVWSIAHTDE